MHHHPVADVDAGMRHVGVERDDVARLQVGFGDRLSTHGQSLTKRGNLRQL